MNTPEHLITCLAEEGVEVALELSKVASKILRFGPTDRSFLDPAGPTNAERLVAELNDLIAVANMLSLYGVIPLTWNSREAQMEKKEKLYAMMRLSTTNGALQPTPMPPA